MQSRNAIHQAGISCLIFLLLLQRGRMRLVHLLLLAPASVSVVIIVGPTKESDHLLVNIMLVISAAFY